MGERLCRLAQAHVVGQDAGQILRTQELQPGQSLALIGTQLEPQAGRRFDLTDPLCRRQLVSQREDIALPAELPATSVVQFGKPRRVETRKTKGLALGEAVEQIDQGRRQRLQAAGLYPNALIGRCFELDRLVVGDLAQQDEIEPA